MVYQTLYQKNTVSRNEVHLFLARGVYAEVILHKRFDWSSLKGLTDKNVNVPRPSEGFIGTARPLQGGGLGKLRTTIGPPKVLSSESSSDDPDSDGTRVRPVLNERSESRKRRRRSNLLANDIIREVVEGIMEAPESPTMEQPNPNVVVVGDEDAMPLGSNNDDTSMAAQLILKDAELASLRDEVNRLNVVVLDKTLEAERAAEEVMELRRALAAVSLDGGMANLSMGDHGAGPSNTQDDSLSFAEPMVSSNPPMVPKSHLEEAEAKNASLKQRISVLVEQYYQWKLACLFTVDRTKQLEVEQRRYDHYLLNNQERVFGLTSWAAIDELFKDDESPTDFLNELSTPLSFGGSQSLVWTKPANFVVDGTNCTICCNPFGPEGGWCLGTCGHYFHPICLISLMVNRRRCPQCMTPLHERLYTVFGLTEYMPPHWEYNEDNAPQNPNMWGVDLVWSWKLRMHSLSKSQLSKEFGWEKDPEQIVRVCHNLINSRMPNYLGRRHFFYQIFNGHWNEEHKVFKFGSHPRKWRWDVNGKRITDDDGNVIVLDPLLPHPAELLAQSESEWEETFRNESLDFLLDEHSPATRRALNGLMNSQVLRAVVEEDGPARRTRSTSRRLILGPNDDISTLEGTNNDEVGPSGTADNPLDIEDA